MAAGLLPGEAADQPKDCGDSCDDDTVSGGASAAQKVASFLRETPPGYI